MREDKFTKEVLKQLREIENKLDSKEAVLVKRIKNKEKISQRILQWILNVFGTIYVLIERFA